MFKVAFAMQQNMPAVVVLLFYVHGKHLCSCRDGQNMPVNPITVNNFAVLVNCMPGSRGSDSMIAPT